LVSLSSPYIHDARSQEPKIYDSMSLNSSQKNKCSELVEKIETHILHSIILFRKSCRLWDNAEKCGRAGQATDDNTVHAR
jgi:hypothetical protein